MTEDEDNDVPPEGAVDLHQSVEIVAIKGASPGILGVLPESYRHSVQDLANPTGVNLLGSLIVDEKGRSAEAQTEVATLRETLTNAQTSLNERNVTIATLNERSKAASEREVRNPALHVLAGACFGVWFSERPLDQKFVMTVFGIVVLAVTFWRTPKGGAA